MAEAQYRRDPAATVPGARTLGTGALEAMPGNTPLGDPSAAVAPTTGTHVVGQRVWNSTPVAGGFIGWVCITAGTPGTFKEWGPIGV